LLIKSGFHFDDLGRRQTPPAVVERPEEIRGSIPFAVCEHSRRKESAVGTARASTAAGVAVGRLKQRLDH
jgi:hypothetical protein